MKFKSSMLVVKDMDRSVKFYKNVLGLHVIADFGANKTLTGGIALQTRDAYEDFIGTADITLGGNDSELYFEEDSFTEFVEHLLDYDIKYVHPVTEHSWGQRAVRFYDPDMHIIEVAESLKSVCGRFLDAGINAQEIALRMDVKQKYVNGWIREIKGVTR